MVAGRAWRRSTPSPSGPLQALALRGAAASVGVLGLVALSAATVRVLPWALDPRVPWRVAVPFARALSSVAVEASVLVGWPVGWALAAFTLGERGEGRVLALLGERPLRTAARLLPMGLALGALLALASLAGGRDASEPGRVVDALLRAGRASCAGAGGARALEVPLVGAAWLCEEDGVHARVVGRAPFALATGRTDALYTARAIDVAPDARRVELDDAWFASPGLKLHVARAVLHLPPFAHASSLPGAWRALLLAASAALSAWLATLLLLAAPHDLRESWSRVHAILLGAAGPIAALTLLHALEVATRPAPLPLYALLPFAAAVSTSLARALLGALPAVHACRPVAWLLRNRGNLR